MRALQSVRPIKMSSVARLTYLPFSQTILRPRISAPDELIEAPLPPMAQARSDARAGADGAASEIRCRFHDRHTGVDQGLSCVAHLSFRECDREETRSSAAGPLLVPAWVGDRRAQR